jgi:hypothetical protein
VLTTLLPSCAECLEIWDPQTSEPSGTEICLHRDSFTFYIRRCKKYTKVIKSHVLIVFYSGLPESLVIENVRIVCIPGTDRLRVDKLGNTVHLRAIRTYRTGLRLSPGRIVTNRHERDISTLQHSSSKVQFVN